MFGRFLNRLEEWLIATLMGVATILVFVAVVHRYAAAFHYPPSLQFIQDALLKINLTWAQELCIFLFIWMAKFGAAYGVRHGTHVGVDTLVRALPPRQARWLTLVGLSGGAIFTGIIGTVGVMFVWHKGLDYTLLHTLHMNTGDLSEGDVSSDLEAPMWMVYLCIPLGSLLMCYRFLQVIWTYWHTNELPHHEVAHVENLPDNDEYYPTPEGKVQP